MPRESAASIAAGRIEPTMSLPRCRPDAPADVRQIFAEIVGNVPRDHFKASDGALIEQHAQAILLARRAYQELEANGPVIDGKASPWLIVLEKAHRSSVALSGRLRLCPQARATSRATARNNASPLSYYQRMALEEQEQQDD